MANADGASPQSGLLRTPLYDLHLECGARMVGFAGYEMPVQFPAGVMKEHLHTRSAAGLFDVSHMGQFRISAAGRDAVADVARALENLLPADLIGLPPGRQRYSYFTDSNGGILDDLMVANTGSSMLLVVNAATKDADEEHLRRHLPEGLRFERLDRALLALQGPLAETVLSRLAPGCGSLRFMDVAELEIEGADCTVSRSGYTGEDGFEISIPTSHARPIAAALLAMDEVQPVGLGARDSLRLEAGLCLYGSDIDTSTTPVTAALTWALPAIRRPGGARAGGFPGADVIASQLRDGVPRLRVGLRPVGKAPVREGIDLFAGEESVEPVGTVTSGGFGPSVGGPVAMGYVARSYAGPGTRLFAEVRGKRLPVDVSQLPFVAPSYKRS